MSNKSLKPCSYNNFVQFAKEIVMPAYYGKNGGALKPFHVTYHKNFRDNFYNWLNASWSKYGQNNCDSFNISYQKLNEQKVSDEYQKAIVKSKIRWNQKMNTECGCTSDIFAPVNIITQPQINVNENIIPPPVTPQIPPTPPPTPMPPPTPTYTPPPTPQRVQQPPSQPSYTSGGTGSGSGY